MSSVKCGTTKISVDEIEYVWTIEDFPLLRTLASSRALPNHDRILSPKFGDPYNGYWYLALFPAGVNCDGTLISVYLFSSSDIVQVALFEISILDNNLSPVQGSEVTLSHPRLFSESDPSWGWEDYIQIKTLKKDQTNCTFDIEPSTTSSSTQSLPLPFDYSTHRIRSSNELLFLTEEDSGALALESHNVCECDEYEETEIFSNWENTTLRHCIFDENLRLKVTVKVHHGLKNSNGSIILPNEITRSASEDFMRLAKDIATFSSSCYDIPTEIISLRSGRQVFSVPKFTLAARSRYFRALFSTSFQETKKIIFNIPVTDASSYVLENAIEYITTGDCKLLHCDLSSEWRLVLNLFLFAGKYEVDSLYDACILPLIASINADSIWDILIAGQQQNSSTLLNAVHDFLKSKVDISTLAISFMRYSFDSTHKEHEIILSEPNTLETRAVNASINEFSDSTAKSSLVGKRGQNNLAFDGQSKNLISCNGTRRSGLNYFLNKSKQFNKCNYSYSCNLQSTSKTENPQIYFFGRTRGDGETQSNLGQ
ncbi:BTB POZ domain-containing protein [Cryptosporidium andersoni]|uniref:BTB POZ domain-containing protein n=1 Tax=Cryptosporidium andersoni TaxID=117008 RepID=A0A1J4MUZ1_9CRYT|nr:BTB POZ domain-containing protein [Cryptosporidium andersoni]